MSETLDASSALDAIFAPRAVDISYRADGCLILRSPIALGECRGHLCEYRACATPRRAAHGCCRKG
jgi:hypothetical protein